ncbi:hypothetical protein QSH46_021785 [Xanthomonas arboricola pv. juglandis]|uniref:hypothetical protein n=1 Tax=Xanthomonas arboricola TaxID=56448 RepID=UPI0002E76838|nr:hypothetical protein [Xanthomonas arboricola]MDN0222726.1 hypothetical protein [Xanthomonas arboricola pv. juglandis]MDN0226969.1 hypothetical protein [Xanthomonas arboricola pv. juglandis]MDN0231242.1 hypothetical protein [Xanthomonas arboricola pv. juglandis]MDN0235487.1 hypothetical protein [Xanthomonas arboricola pv. juglandis]MDN0239738.1 hypothetical protein [Xanthomonas arboricola pv. juglandis]
MNDTNTETVTITRARYVELLEDEEFLSALRAAGVDNWDGYDYALEISQDVG